MYAYLNDISLNYPIGQTGDSFSLVSEVIDITNLLWDEYSIEYTKVPNDFKDKKIAGQYSIKEIIENYEDNDESEYNEFADLRFKLLGFLGNRVFSNIDEIDEEILKEYESKNAWVSVSTRDSESQLLTGAYLLSRPTISFRTDPYFEVDYLPCKYHIEYSKDNIKTKDDHLKNLFSVENVENHKQYLIEVKKAIKFPTQNWDATKNPIWNDKTKDLLEKMQFPQSLDGLKEKISELKEVGELVAELNGWKKDDKITKYNRSKDHIRLIFTTYSRPGVAYLSIDIKNPKGCFEHYDHRGHHLGEISFEDGKPIPRGGSDTGKDTKGKHNLKLKRN